MLCIYIVYIVTCLCKVNIPCLIHLFADYGCAGVSSVAYGLIAREIERVDSSYRYALRAHRKSD